MTIYLGYLQIYGGKIFLDCITTACKSVLKLQLRCFSMVYGSKQWFCSDEKLTCKKDLLCVDSSMKYFCYAWLLSSSVQLKLSVFFA